MLCKMGLQTLCPRQSKLALYPRVLQRRPYHFRSCFGIARIQSWSGSKVQLQLE